LAIQAFAALPHFNNADDGYRLGLRVYRADAFNDNTPLKGNGFCWKQSKTSNFHWGLGHKAPLIETTEILSLIELPIEITAIVLAVVNDINVDCNLLNCSIFYQQREAMA